VGHGGWGDGQAQRNDMDGGCGDGVEVVLRIKTDRLCGI
jgi:hypothetical protein